LACLVSRSSTLSSKTHFWGLEVTSKMYSQLRSASINLAMVHMPFREQLKLDEETSTQEL
jgi:hypothetical protein